MKLTIFWTWYVGLVTGACLAEVWHEVLCIDVDIQKIEHLKEGIIPIYEPGLEELVLRNYKEGRLHFSTDARVWVEFAEVIFSAVGTPPDTNHKADLKYVKTVAETVGKYMNGYKVFINKSTVPVGTGKLCAEIIKKTSGINDFDIISNPEFLKEWVAVRDFMLPDRIVCGTKSQQARDIMTEIYKPFLRANRGIIFMSIESAEICKYASNAFLATKISFINEIANFAELVGGNVSEIANWMGFDDRIGNRFLHAGIGYGGSCFPKDVEALIETGKEYGYDFQIISATEKVNKTQKTKVIKKLQKHLDILWKIVTLWGLSFKPKTDDIREAPSISIIEELLSLWVKKIQCFDPISISHMQKLFFRETKVSFFENNYDALKNSDALLLLTEWDMFRMLNTQKIKSMMRGNIIIDGRNIWNRKELENKNFIYEAIWK